MKTVVLSCFLWTIGTLFGPAAGDEAALTEKQKIEALIVKVEKLKDAKFVRNGTAYDAKTAAKFLKGKWDAGKDEIVTARDFIDKAATKSSTTGKHYLIRAKDGKETPARDWLHELKKIETPPADAKKAEKKP